MKRTLAFVLLLTVGTSLSAQEVQHPFPFTPQQQAIAAVIDTSIGWAIKKDKEALYRCFVQDSSFFIFHPGDNTIIGFAEFRDLVETVFMNPAFVATDYRIRDLRIHLSLSEDAAWFSCLSDDHGLWEGEPSGWEDCRWTGVLIQQDGRWKIAQMHFSYESPGP